MVIHATYGFTLNTASGGASPGSGVATPAPLRYYGSKVSIVRSIVRFFSWGGCMGFLYAPEIYGVNFINCTSKTIKPDISAFIYL